jgi:formylglycine-generating enzyme required for sulfatase activity
MHGNVWDWCLDQAGSNPYRHFRRGGGRVTVKVGDLRSAFRTKRYDDDTFYDIGFRLALSYVGVK